MDINGFFEPYIPAGGVIPEYRAQDLGYRFMKTNEQNWYESLLSEQNDREKNKNFDPLDSSAKIEVAILGIPEERGSIDNKGCAAGADIIRAELFSLQDHLDFTLIDLGNLKPGNSLRDTYKALEITLIELASKKIFPIILGGSQDLSYAQFSALGESNQKVDLLSIDSCFDLDENEDAVLFCNSASWLKNVLSHEPDILFNYSNIGYQTYFTNPPLIRLMDKLCFDIHRLGEISGNIQDTEPVIRSAHMISFDVNAIRFSDAPGRGRQSPHGFYGEEACQIMRYAGMNAQLSSLGLYEYNPSLDCQTQTAQLIAQMIWYFLDGFSIRKKENPLINSANFLKFRTSVNNGANEIIFFKSRKTARWWMQVPYPERYAKNDHFHLVPCLYEDYNHASHGEMPDRWWKTFQKF